MTVKEAKSSCSCNMICALQNRWNSYIAVIPKDMVVRIALAMLSITR